MFRDATIILFFFFFLKYSSNLSGVWFGRLLLHNINNSIKYYIVT